jgi:arginyl-tRNA synthetase
VQHAVCRAVEDGALQVAVPAWVKIERPRAGGTGDWATNAALTLAGPAGLTPRDVAEILRSRIEATAGIDRVEITGPGFLNFTLAAGQAGLIRTVLRAGAEYGHGDALAGTTASFAPADEIRAAVWTRTVVGLLRSQGADAAVVAGAPEILRVAPAGPGASGPAARWGLLRAAAQDRPCTGPELLVQRESNPLFRVRYAYARTRALARNAAQLGISPGYDQDPRRRPDAGAAALVAALADYPAVLETAARLRAPDRVARHLERAADAFLRFQETGRLLPVGDEKPSAAHSSRLALADAAGTVLAGGLSLLGIDAPEHL